jgi:hypothetical protein
MNNHRDRDIIQFIYIRKEFLSTERQEGVIPVCMTWHTCVLYIRVYVIHSSVREYVSYHHERDLAAAAVPHGLLGVAVRGGVVRIVLVVLVAVIAVVVVADAGAMAVAGAVTVAGAVALIHPPLPRLLPLHPPRLPFPPLLLSSFRLVYAIQTEGHQGQRTQAQRLPQVHHIQPHLHLRQRDCIGILELDSGRQRKRKKNPKLL